MPARPEIDYTNTPLRLQPEENLLSKRAIARSLKISAATVNKLLAQEGCPQPLTMGTHPRWRAGALSDYLDSQGTRR